VSHPVIVEAATPVPLSDSTGAVMCRCGAASPAGASCCAACGCFLPGTSAGSAHRFAPGNAARWGGGLRSERPTLALVGERAAEVAAQLDARRAAIVADLGGEEQLTAIALGEVERYLRLGVLADEAWAVLERAGGSYTTRGRRRDAQRAFLEVSAAQGALAARLGLQRRERPVDPLDAVRRAVEEAKG
jgi:hypothetical protein